MSKNSKRDKKHAEKKHQKKLRRKEHNKVQPAANGDKQVRKAISTAQALKDKTLEMALARIQFCNYLDRAKENMTNLHEELSAKESTPELVQRLELVDSLLIQIDALRLEANTLRTVIEELMKQFGESENAVDKIEANMIMLNAAETFMKAHDQFQQAQMPAQQLQQSMQAVRAAGHMPQMAEMTMTPSDAPAPEVISMDELPQEVRDQLEKGAQDLAAVQAAQSDPVTEEQPISTEGMAPEQEVLVEGAVELSAPQAEGVVVEEAPISGTEMVGGFTAQDVQNTEPTTEVLVETETEAAQVAPEETIPADAVDVAATPDGGVSVTLSETEAQDLVRNLSGIPTQA